MSKPPAKRKASDANLDINAAMAPSGSGTSSQLLASLDLSNPRTTPKTIAAALLSLLPDGATRQNTAAKKLAKSFPLVMTELDARSNILARANVSEGTRLPIAFRFPAAGGSTNDGGCGEGGAMTVINIPEDSFVAIMRFLKGKDVVKLSLVNKAWLSATRTPVLWERLDQAAGLVNSSGKKLNMTSFLKLLGRPQFVNLKSLTMPNKVKLGKKSIKQMAKVCPHLQTFELGYSGHVSGPKIKDDDLIEVAQCFTNLQSIRTDMWNITNFGIASVAMTMEGRLLDLRIRGDWITKHYLSDAALGVVAKSCPNLKHFAYKLSYHLDEHYDAEYDFLSGAGIIALVKGCRRLEILELEKAKQIGKDAFVTILKMLAREDDSASLGTGSDGRDFALRKIELKGYPFVIRGSPFCIEDVDLNPFRSDGYGYTQGD